MRALAALADTNTRAKKHLQRHFRRLPEFSETRIYAAMKVEASLMLSAASEASELLKSLANRHRLLIVCQLVDGERSVGELAEFLGIRDSTVSQHLALLRRDGVVSARRDAQTIYYGIASPPARRILETLYEIFCAPGPICATTAEQRSARARTVKDKT